VAAPILKLFGVGKDLVTSQMSQERGTQSVNTTISDGKLLQGQELTTAEIGISHGLGRVPVGYLVAGLSANETVYHATAATREKLYLKASGTVTATIWVF
jgi:hypothetical protein